VPAATNDRETIRGERSAGWEAGGLGGGENYQRMREREAMMAMAGIRDFAESRRVTSTRIIDLSAYQDQRPRSDNDAFTTPEYPGD